MSLPFCMCDCAECVYRGIYTSLCNAVGLKTNFFFLQDVLGHDYSYAHFLVSSAEVIPTFTFYKADGQLCQYTGLLLSLHTCCCDGLSPGWQAAACAVPGAPCVLGGGLWKGIRSHFPVFEGVPGPDSLLTARPVSPYFLCTSSLSGFFSCPNLWGYLAPFPHTFLFLALTTA